MAIVKKIQELCKERGMTIPKLEKEAGFSNGSIYKWDTNTPGIDRIQKVAKCFGVSIDFLIQEDVISNGDQTHAQPGV